MILTGMLLLIHQDNMLALQKIINLTFDSTFTVALGELKIVQVHLSLLLILVINKLKIYMTMKTAIVAIIILLLLMMIMMIRLRIYINCQISLCQHAIHITITKRRRKQLTWIATCVRIVIRLCQCPCLMCNGFMVMYNNRIKGVKITRKNKHLSSLARLKQYT